MHDRQGLQSSVSQIPVCVSVTTLAKTLLGSTLRQDTYSIGIGFSQFLIRGFLFKSYGMKIFMKGGL